MNKTEFYINDRPLTVIDVSSIFLQLVDRK